MEDMALSSSKKVCCVNKILPWMLVLSVLIMPITNVLTFYFGAHTVKELRNTVVMGIMVAYFVIAIIVIIVLLFKSEKMKFSSFALLSIPIILMLAAYAYAVIRYGVHGYAAKYLLQFGCVCVPAFYIGYICARQHKQQVFVKALDIYGWFLLPFIVISFVWLFTPWNVNKQLEGIGVFAYTSIGYILVSLMIIQFIMISFSNVKWKAFRIVELAVCAFLMVATGAKGPFVLMVIFLSICFVVRLFMQKSKKFKQNVGKLSHSIIAAIVCFITIVILLFVAAPPNIESGRYRIASYSIAFRDGKIQEGYSLGNKEREYLYSSGNEESTVKESAVKESAVKESAVKESTGKESTGKESTGKESTDSYGRIELLKLAINETKEHPLTGLGPFGYVQKHGGNYTHNVIADFFAEYGVIVACLFVAFVVFAYVKMGKSIKATFSIAELFVLLFLTGTCLELGFREYFPAFQPFWFFIGYAVWFIIPRKQQRKKELNTDEAM